MNITQLYRQHNIPIAPDGHAHSLSGWVNVECPFCEGNQGFHLGYNTDKDYFNCWRCGWHPPKDVIQTLLKVDPSSARQIVSSIRAAGRSSIFEKPVKPAQEHKLPSGTGPLSPGHKRYLKARGFNPHALEREWGLLGTGPVSQLDGADYKHRIIAPIWWNGQPVSFQSRDFTNKAAAKYKACPKDRELVHHKDILYTHPKLGRGGSGICVEGITDVWRFGPSVAFATFGIEFTQAQVNKIVQYFTHVAIVFDNEPQAQKQAHKLCDELSMARVHASVCIVPNDPASMTQEEANNYITELSGIGRRP